MTTRIKTAHNKNDLLTFVNCSNHPWSGWNEDQKQAVFALGYADILDIPGGFPHIDPSATTEEVEELADNMVATMLENKATGAFVAGEYTLVVALLIRLQHAGVTCYTATTNRVTKEFLRPDGTTQKDVQYRFVQWRKYPTL